MFTVHPVYGLFVGFWTRRAIRRIGDSGLLSRRYGRSIKRIIISGTQEVVIIIIIIIHEDLLYAHSPLFRVILQKKKKRKPIEDDSLHMS